MNDILHFIQNFCDNKDEHKTVNEFFAPKLDIIGQNQEASFKVLRELDPSKHSLMYTWVLLGILQHKKNWKNYDFNNLNSHVTNYFLHFNPQLLLGAFSRFYSLGQLYAEYLILMKKPIYGIKPLKQAILAIRDQIEQFTPLHREFAKLCLKAKCYQHSLQIIDTPITSFKKNTQPMDILSYVYYKGLLFTGLKKYSQAIDNFMLVLSLPTNIIHKVHVESYKKLILLTLITTNKSPTFPNYVSQMLKVKLETYITYYLDLKNAYVTKQDTIFKSVIEQRFMEFDKDKNWGLVLKLQKQYERRRICELNNTYLTLQYNEIMNADKNLKNIEDIESILFQMINDNLIQAKIDSQQQMIAFIDSSENKVSEESRNQEYLEVIEELEQQNKRIIQLMSKVEKVDTNIKQSEEYIKKTLITKEGFKEQDFPGDAQSQMIIT